MCREHIIAAASLTVQLIEFGIELHDRHHSRNTRGKAVGIANIGNIRNPCTPNHTAHIMDKHNLGGIACRLMAIATGRARPVRRMEAHTMTEHYLSFTEFAERIGVRTGALGHYKLPEPDAVIGRTRGWKAETVDAWNASRPGHGGRPTKVRQS